MKTLPSLLWRLLTVVSRVTGSPVMVSFDDTDTDAIWTSVWAAAMAVAPTPVPTTGAQTTSTRRVQDLVIRRPAGGGRVEAGRWSTSMPTARGGAAWRTVDRTSRYQGSYSATGRGAINDIPNSTACSREEIPIRAAAALGVPLADSAGPRTLRLRIEIRAKSGLEMNWTAG